MKLAVLDDVEFINTTHFSKTLALGKITPLCIPFMESEGNVSRVGITIPSLAVQQSPIFSCENLGSLFFYQESFKQIIETLRILTPLREDSHISTGMKHPLSACKAM